MLSAWRGMGGVLAYGSAEETSVFLMVPGREIRQTWLWPAAIYPSGKVEVVFQWLQYRPPFDDIALREELRQRLNAVPGIDLPAVKHSMRPGFEVAGRPPRGYERALLRTTVRPLCLHWGRVQAPLTRAALLDALPRLRLGNAKPQSDRMTTTGQLA